MLTKNSGAKEEGLVIKLFREFIISKTFYKSWSIIDLSTINKVDNLL